MSFINTDQPNQTQSSYFLKISCTFYKILLKCSSINWLTSPKKSELIVKKIFADR